MSKKVFIAIALVSVIFAAGCVNPKDNAIGSCENLCGQKSNEGQNLSSGPCLSGEIAPGWVCDIAHNPRQAVDDLPENQCSAFRNGTAHHFVEVDEKCNLIRAV
ncbi:Uncharacterised protein [uncultured archaeon]|nr:Uncharacterised protein [uncultured archaeon]